MQGLGASGMGSSLVCVLRTGLETGHRDCLGWHWLFVLELSPLLESRPAPLAAGKPRGQPRGTGFASSQPPLLSPGLLRPGSEATLKLFRIPPNHHECCTDSSPGFPGVRPRFFGRRLSFGYYPRKFGDFFSERVNKQTLQQDMCDYLYSFGVWTIVALYFAVWSGAGGGIRADLGKTQVVGRGIPGLFLVAPGVFLIAPERL